MQLLENVNLKKYLSFSNSVQCDRLIIINHLDDLGEALRKFPNAHILGGGSNVLITKSNIDTPILKIDLKGKRIIKEEEDYCLVEANAGEVWHDLVCWAVDQDLGGIENLSLIPGLVGAAPIQNIGAYGVELKDILHSVSVYDRKHNCLKVFHASECQFGYRDSIFKSAYKNRFVVTSIILRLTKSIHALRTGYGAIQDKLKDLEIEEPSIKELSSVIIDIRKQKLPDPKEIGNAGSFFKNPIIPIDVFEKLQSQFDSIPNYPVSKDEVKVPAGWLIEQCGWKGKRVGNTGCYKNQALVIVNYGEATGEEIATHAKSVQQSVFEKFGIEITPEVNIFS